MWFAAAARADQIYKSVDADGHVVYSDHAQDASAEKTDIHVQQPDREQAARNAKELAIEKAEENQRRKQQAADAAAALKKSQAEHARDVQCENARQRYDSLKDSRRVYSTDADGNRTYLAGADAEAKREEARQAVTAACGP
jgi:hypothetical protein